MKVLTPCSVKIGKEVHRLTVGNDVPKIVLEFWKKSGSLEGLKKDGTIGDGAPVHEKPISEKKIDEKK
jgi:hypothetical protein